MNKEYVVKLTGEERERLGKLISAGTAPARMLKTGLASCSKPTSESTPKGRCSSIER
jgi:hypothetical protein